MTVPTFATWKQYGFRHIADTDERITEPPPPNRHDIEHIFGETLCGINYVLVVNKGTTLRASFHGRPPTRGDVRDTKRPLCGHCRNKYKKQTGKEIQ